MNDHKIRMQGADGILITPLPVDRLRMQATRRQEMVFFQRDFNFLRVATATVLVIPIVNAAWRGGIHQDNDGIPPPTTHRQEYSSRNGEQDREHGSHA